MEDGTGIKILLVEDNEEYLSMTLSLLEGHKKCSARSGKDGILMFKKHFPNISFVDITLPDMDGFEVLKEIRALNPEAYVVMLTGSKNAQDVLYAKNKHANGYLTKPFSRSQLLSYVDNYSQNRDDNNEILDKKRLDLLLSEVTPRGEQVDRPKSEKASHEKSPLSSLSAEQVEALAAKKILFVDDYLVNQKRAAQYLSDLGCTIEVADTAKEAAEKATASHYDIIFLDISVESSTGSYDAGRSIRHAEKAKNNNHSAYIIAMAENIDEIRTKAWLKAGMDSYVIKPTSFSALKDIVLKQVKGYTH